MGKYDKFNSQHSEVFSLFTARVSCSTVQCVQTLTFYLTCHFINKEGLYT